VRVVGYVRVSTDRQAEDGQGLPVQEKAIRAWCRTNRHRLVALYRDEGVSGAKPVAERPGLLAALAAVKDGQACALVVPKLDRLARSLGVQEAALGMVWRSGGRVFSLDHGEILCEDTEDPYRTAMRQMMGVFSQLERGVIVARMKAGRAHKAEQGGYAYGAPGYGQRAEGGALVAEATEQAALARMRALRTDGASLRTIAATLDAEGHKPKRGGTWQPRQVGRILQRVR
jgi:DNA invertase Pin-like site-specific DNA recombinase